MINAWEAFNVSIQGDNFELNNLAIQIVQFLVLAYYTYLCTTAKNCSFNLWVILSYIVCVTNQQVSEIYDV